VRGRDHVALNKMLMSGVDPFKDKAAPSTNGQDGGRCTPERVASLRQQFCCLLGVQTCLSFGTTDNHDWSPAVNEPEA